MTDDPDLHTVFMTHEIENGLNPEVNPGLYERLLGGQPWS